MTSSISFFRAASATGSQDRRDPDERRHARRAHTKHLGAGPYERVEARNGHANVFKPRAFHTSMGGLDLAMPQVRGSGVPFRTTILEKGSRSDRALKARHRHPS